LFGICFLLWPVVINKTIMQQNRIKTQRKSVRTKTKMLEQSPAAAQLAHDTKSTAVIIVVACCSQPRTLDPKGDRNRALKT